MRAQATEDLRRMAKEAARLLAVLAREKWGPALGRHHILTIKASGHPWLEPANCVKRQRAGPNGVCGHCGAIGFTGPSVFEVYGLPEPAAGASLRIADAHFCCVARFAGESADALQRYELYLTLRAGSRDPGSPLRRLPSEVFCLLWAWCARALVWDP